MTITELIKKLNEIKNKENEYLDVGIVFETEIFNINLIEYNEKSGVLIFLK